MAADGGLIAVIPVIGIIVLVAELIVLRICLPSISRHDAIATVLWMVPHLVMLGVVACWGSFGDIAVETGEVAVFTAVVAGFGLVVPLRTWMKSRLGRSTSRLAHLVSMARDAGVLVIVCILSFISIELPWNELVGSMAVSFALVNLSVIFIILLMCYALGQRTGVLAAVAVMGFAALGVAQHFVVDYKGASIMPSDLTALSTAAEVSGGLSFELEPLILASIALAAVSCTLLAFVAPLPCGTKRVQRVNLAANLTGALALALVAGGLFGSVDFCSLGFTYNYWISVDPYKEQGFMGSFVTLLQLMEVPEPEQYDAAEARALEESLAQAYDETLGADPARLAAEQQFEALKPTVITIMCETFADLSEFNGLGVGYQGPLRVKSISDAVASGFTYPSVQGGGTCNSEFEYLTSSSMAFVGESVYPYTTYDLSHVPSLARQFSDLGYDTVAIHPAAATNWNRDGAYQGLGFDEFLDISDFPDDAAYFHSGVSDAAMYDLVLETVADDASPTFVMGVTMQNHMSYEQNNIPQELRGPTAYPGIDAVTSGKMAEYIGCIEESDRALADFIEKLRMLDRPVVLVFFGDHQPNISTPFNDYYFPDDPELVHTERTHKTPYFIWANYDLAGSDQISSLSDCGLNGLAARLLHAIGAPLSDYQKAEMVAMQEVPVMNGAGYRRADGVWCTYDDRNRTRVVNELENIQYLELGSKL